MGARAGPRPAPSDQPHQLLRAQSQRGASPSSIRMPSIELPLRAMIRSLRPYWSMSHDPIDREKGSTFRGAQAVLCRLAHFLLRRVDIRDPEFLAVVRWPPVQTKQTVCQCQLSSARRLYCSQDGCCGIFCLHHTIGCRSAADVEEMDLARKPQLDFDGTFGRQGHHPEWLMRNALANHLNFLCRQAGQEGFKVTRKQHQIAALYLQCTIAIFDPVD